MVDMFETRAQKIGLLIREARKKASKETAECARAIGISSAEFDAFEDGEQAPSLPELEALAYYLDLPLEYFLGLKAATDLAEEPKLAQIENLLLLRNRIIGVMLRKARLEAGITLEELARYVEITPEKLEACETGEVALSVPELEVICQALNISLRDFQVQGGPIGRWALQKKSVEGFLELPLELQQFISKPINLPYLQLAQRLSEMSVDRLRNVAEGLLEITL